MLLLGAVFIRGKRPLKTYLASEVILAGPTLFVALSFIMSGGVHILSFGQGWGDAGLHMLLVMVVFDIIPCWMAVQALRRPEPGGWSGF